jgi:PadR family transcriptional regulator PadR
MMSEQGNLRGRRGGRGQGRRRRRVMQFLQPCLLLLLRHGEAHGYALLSEIERFGFNPEHVDPSLVYRALREMEQAGWIRSDWDEEESQGPRRRVYQLVTEGQAQLEFWMEDLHRTRDEINHLLEAFADHEEDGESA